MAVARRKTKSRSFTKDADGSPEGALKRLREIAENGLDDPALSGFDDISAVNTNEDADQSGEIAEPMKAALTITPQMRIAEALVFASPEPVSEAKIAAELPEGEDISALMQMLQASYSGRGVQLVRVAGKWAFRTADDLSFLLERFAVEERRLSKAALETLAIIAYHQPVTRSEIEEIRGVQTSRGTLDVLMESSWVRPRGRRRAPGKPVTYGTTDAFLEHFGLEGLGELPGLAELKGAGLLDSDLPPDFEVPSPKDVAALMPDELPLEDDDAETDEFDDADLIEEHDEEASDVEARPEPKTNNTTA